jgi:hypothetical protein
VTSQRSYDAADFIGAEWEIALRGGLVEMSVRPLLLALVEIADGLVEELDRIHGESDETAARHAVAAFSYGFVIAADLRGQELSTIGVELLPDALSGVAARGRHAIIAAECDLQAFAELQRRTAGSLVGRTTGDGASAAGHPRLARVFESGFALGLLLCDSAAARAVGEIQDSG